MRRHKCLSVVEAGRGPKRIPGQLRLQFLDYFILITIFQSRLGGAVPWPKAQMADSSTAFEVRRHDPRSSYASSLTESWTAPPDIGLGDNVTMPRRPVGLPKHGPLRDVLHGMRSANYQLGS